MTAEQWLPMEEVPEIQLIEYILVSSCHLFGCLGFVGVKVNIPMLGFHNVDLYHYDSP